MRVYRSSLHSYIEIDYRDHTVLIPVVSKLGAISAVFTKNNIKNLIRSLIQQRYVIHVTGYGVICTKLILNLCLVLLHQHATISCSWSFLMFHPISSNLALTYEFDIKRFLIITL